MSMWARKGPASMQMEPWSGGSEGKHIWENTSDHCSYILRQIYSSNYQSSKEKSKPSCKGGKAPQMLGMTASLKPYFWTVGCAGMLLWRLAQFFCWCKWTLKIKMSWFRTARLQLTDVFELFKFDSNPVVWNGVHFPTGNNVINGDWNPESWASTQYTNSVSLRRLSKLCPLIPFLSIPHHFSLSTTCLPSTQ